MNRKKILIVLMSIFIGIVLMMNFFVQNMYNLEMNYPVRGYSDEEILYVRRSAKRNQDEMGYSINNPVNGSSGNAQRIWNLLNMKNSSTDDYFLKSDDGYKTLYCLDVTKWMGNIGTNEANSNTVTYNRKYDMDTENSSIVNENLYPVLGSSLDGISNYNALLWLMDNIYIPNDSYYKNNQAEKIKDKMALLKGAGIEYDSEYDVYTYFDADGVYRECDESSLLTDDDIEAIQQAVIWRYTLNESSNQQTKDTLKFNIQDKKLTLYYTTNGTTYNVFSNIKYSADGSSDIPAKDQQAVVLYNYLTRKADENGKNNYTSVISSPISVSKTGLELVSDNKYKIGIKDTSNGFVLGPINISKNNELPYDISFELKDGNKSITSIDAQISTDYRKINKNIWCNRENNTYQPIVEPSIAKENETINLIAEPEVKEFDLALRKYITKVDGKNVNQTRIPDIDMSKLNSLDENGNVITTGTYKHRNC